MSRKQIAVDLLKLRHLNTGLGQVCLAYGRELAAINHPDIQFTFLVPRNFTGYFGDTVKYKTPSLLTRFFPCLNAGFDLWHATNQDAAYFPPKQTPFVLTIHDLNFILEKTSGKVRRRKKRLNAKIRRASQVVAISNHTKSDIEQHLAASAPIKVIYNGVDIATDIQGKRPAFADSEAFFFAIGVFKPNKNYEALVDMMASFPGKRLIIAGSHNSLYGWKIIELIRKKGLQGRIFTPGPVTDEERAWLYSHCEALLFPSTNEGMGMPIIEAMRFGKPVITSSLSCMPEFGGKYAYYFHSFEPLDMVQTIERSLQDYRQRPEWKQDIIDYSAQFLWKKNAQQYTHLFEQLLAIH